jgi:hypothetical protein
MSEEQKQKAIEDRSRILPSGTIYVGGNVSTVSVLDGDLARGGHVR